MEDYSFSLGTINRNANTQYGTSDGVVSVSYSVSGDISSCYWTIVLDQIQGGAVICQEKAGLSTGSASGAAISPTTAGTHTLTCARIYANSGTAYLRLQAASGNWRITPTFHVVTNGSSGATEFSIDSSTVRCGDTITFTVSDTSRINSSYTHFALVRMGSTDTETVELPHTATDGKAQATITIPESWAATFSNTSTRSAMALLGTYGPTGLLGWRSKDIVLTADAPSAPTEVTVAHVSSNPTVSGWGVYVQNMSQCQLTISGAEAKQGATIAGYQITCMKVDGPTVTDQWMETTTSNPYTTPLLASDGTFRFSVKTVDSRGALSSAYTTAAESDITVQPYSMPTVSVTVQRCNSGGTVSSDGEYAKLTGAYGFAPVGAHNSVSAVYTYAVSGITPPSGSDLTLVAGHYEQVIAQTFSDTSTYVFSVTVTDGLNNSTTATATLATASFTFHMMEGGEGAAFGKAAEKAGYLELAADWDLWLGKYSNKLIDLVVPIGCVKIFADGTNPNTLYKGTRWEAIQDVFLLASGPTYHLGDQNAGAATDTVTVPIEMSNLPGGVVTSRQNTSGSAKTVDYLNAWDNGSIASNAAATVNNSTGATEFETAGQYGQSLSITVDTMPPYQIVNVWKRVK